MQKVFSFGLMLLALCPAVFGQAEAPSTNQTKAAGAPAAAAKSEQGNAANIRFQFDGIPYMDVVERFAQMANKPLIAETNVQGTVTFNDPRPYTYPEALETLNTILSMKNVMLVETERYLQLVPFKDLPQMPLKIFRGLDKTGDVRPGEIVTVVLELKNLDASETAKAASSMLSSAGSVAPLTRGKGLIITDRLENIRRIKQLLAEIDTSSPVQRQMKTYTLVHASGAVVADLINKTFGASTAPKRTIWNESKKSFDTLPPDPEDYVTAVYDEASRTLLLFGPGERVTMAEELIHKFEDKEGGRGGEVKIFYPRATKAEELARMIRQAIPGVAGENENASSSATKARVIVDREMNRLIVAAPIAGQLDSIENLIARVERSTGDGPVTETKTENVQITKVIRLQIADAATAFRVLTNAFTRRNTYGEPVLSLKANLDPQTKTVVLTGSPGDIQHAMGIIEQMENISPATGPQETVFLDFASASEMKRVQPLLQQLYVSQVSDGTLGNAATARFLPDAESKRLIVSASGEHIKIIQKIAEQLKSPAIATQPREFRAITLKNVKVDQAFKSISDLTAERMNDDVFRDIAKPLLLSDATNNRLLITANAAQLKEIEQIVQAVDLAPKKTERQIANISLQSQNAAQVLPSLTQLMRPLVDAHPDASSRPEVIADANGKSLIVSAAPEDIEKIREMVRQIEGTKTDGAARQFKAVKLYNRSPSEVATLAEQLYREQLKGQPDPAGGPASFVPETKGNRVIVIGTEAEVARAENIIRQIDPTLARTAKDETRVIRLRNAQAQDLATLVEKSLNLDEEKVKLLVDVRSNSLVVSGSAAGVESAAQMIEQLDILPNTQPKEVRMIELKSADARTVVPLLQDLLGDVMRNTRGSNYVLQSRLVADTNANRVIVTGTADELQQVNALVQRLDSAPQQTEGTRVFQLHSSSATEMAKVVSDSMITYGPGNQQIKRVTVAPDEKSNSLVVTGSRTDLQDVQVIIEKLDGGERKGGREVKVIELQTDEPSKLVTVAQQVWNAQSQGRAGFNEISFTLDPSGKRVIVVAPSNLMPQVEQVITSLDQKPDGPARSLQTVELKKRPASAIFSVLTRLYEEQEKGKKTKPATIVPESSGKRLLVYGSEEQAATIKGIVEKLESDSEPSERETKMFEVGQPEDATRLLPLVQQLYQEQMKGGADPADAQILADEQGGRLIVTARSGQLAKIEEIISKLTSGKLEPKQHETRIYNLSSSTATELAQTVNSLYAEEIKKNPGLSNSKALILPDSIANRLIVSGLSNQVASIEQIIKQLDQVSPQTGGTRVFKLKSASADQVASILSTALVEHNRNNLRSIPRVSVGADTNSNSLVVSGEAKDLNAAATIIEQLDSSTEHKEREMRILALKSGRAAELANRVRALYVDHVKNNPTLGPADALIMGDSTSDRLIVTASEAQLEAIQKIVSQLDEINSGEDRQLAVRPLKKTSATSMAALVQQFFSRNINSRDPQLRLVVTPSPDDRSLILEGSDETLSKVDELAQTLDERPEDQNVQVRSYQVAESRAAELAPTLSRIFAERNPGEPSQQPRFEADAGSNLIFVAATPEQFEIINKLIEEVKANAEVSNEIRTFKLVHSDAEQLVPVLSSMLKAEDPNIPPWRRQQFRTSNDPKTVNVAAAPAVNAIVVQGPPAALKSAEQIIQSLDNGEQAGKAIIQTIHLKKGTADQIADAVNKALLARAPKSNTQRATVTPVFGSNSLLIDGPAESVQDVVKIVQELDQESSGGDVEIRVYKLEHGKARELSGLLNQMLQSVLRENARARRGGGDGGGGGRRSAVTVTPDERTNSLIVSANPEQFKTIEQLLVTLDQNSAKTDRSVRFVLLKNARATSVSNRLNLMFENRPKDERPVIESDTFANTVTIIGSKADIAEAESVISELDQVPKEESLQVRMLVVENLPATQMAKMLKSLYSQMSNTEIQLVDRLTPQTRGVTNQPAATDQQTATTNKAVVTIAVDPTANALLLSGPSNELDAINRLVDELTWSSLGNDAEFRQFALKEADPVAVAKTLSELFKPEPIRVQPRQGGEAQVVQPAARMTIVAEPRTRSIIVRAKATDFILLESLLQQLDQKSPTAQLAFRLVQLTNAEPAKLLPLVNEMIKQMGLTRPGEAVSVVADPRTRSMFVVGRESMLNDVESMIKNLDTPAAFAEAEVALVPLKNTIAAQLATILQNMLKPGQAGETTPEARELQEQVRSLRIKDDDAREILLDLTKPIKIMPDSAPGAKGGNRLIVSSTPDNLKALRAVIEMMDTVAVVEGVIFKIIRLQNADAQSVSQTLQDIFQQGKQLAVGPAGPAQPDSETGKALAGPLTIATDRRSNSLILSGKPESINLAQRLLRDLDEEFKGFVTTVRLYHLNYASAVRLAPLLQTVFTEASPIPGTEGLANQVTRLQTLMNTNEVAAAKTTQQPKTRAALTIQADDPSNTLIVAARADMLPLIEDVIRSMDIPAATGMEVVRIYPLKNADASRLQKVITDIYTARGNQLRPEEKPGLSVDNRTNALIVSGNERIFAFIETIITQLDKDLPFEYGEFRVIKLENADAVVVAQHLQQILDTRAQQKAVLSAQPAQAMRAIVIGDPRINSLIVGGATEVFELVQALAKQLDVPGIALSGQIRLVPLKNANAGTISSALNNLFNQRYSTTRSADVQRNRPIIIPDPRINALLVSAGVEDNKALDELLLKLDQKIEDPALSLAVIGLKHNDAGRVGDMIQTVFAGRLQAMTLPGSTPNPQDRVVVSTDALSNALVVLANKENLQTIQQLIEKVDKEPEIEGGIFQIIALKNADATRVASMLRNLISQGLYRPGMLSARGQGQNARARDAMAIAVDPRSNTLIVSASPENLAIIKEVINQIDSKDYALEGDIKLYSLKHARASQLAQSLQQFFQAKRAGEQQGRENERTLPVTIIGDDRTNTILVTGGKDAFDAVDRMLLQLDSEDVADKMNFRVFPLKNSTATKLQGTLTRLFQNRPIRITGKPNDPITVVADSWANALIVGAAVDDMSMVANLIETLDNTQPENMQVQVIPVVKGDARSISQTIISLYRDTPGAPPTIRVDVDERLNALVVSAGEADIKRINELVQKLDAAQVARVSEIKIFPLKFAQAEELAQVLTTAFTGRPLDASSGTTATTSPARQSMLQFITRTAEGEELVASALKESLLITSDRRRNALVISAPVDSMNLLGRIITSLDSESPQLAKIRVFRLQNADARQMADVLTSLFRLRQQPGVPPNQRAIQYTLVRDAMPGEIAMGEPVTATIGSAEQYALTVTVDFRTNGLLLGGTDHYVGLAAHIIEELDSTPAQEHKTEVYRLKNSLATNVVTALNSFVEQERRRIMAVAEQADMSTNAVSSVVGNLQQQFEREVAIVAEPISNTLLLSASPRYFEKFRALIEELDQPMSQVLIQVVLAEVTLDKNSELGVEWAVQGAKNGTKIQTGTDFGVADQVKQFGGFSSAITGSDVSFVLRALQEDGRLEVLSRPQILTADNQKATIDIGERVPLVTDSRVTERGDTINSFRYENVGVSLTVTPRISPDGFVKMEVEPTVSQITSSSVTVSPGITSPIIAERKATTTVSVQNGQSVIIGGLIATSDDSRRKKVPFLGNIPYVGFLFRSSKTLSNRKELLIILTPQLLAGKDALAQADSARQITHDQLQRSSLKDEKNRDKLQQEILEPLLPLMQRQEISTNSVAPKT